MSIYQSYQSYLAIITKLQSEEQCFCYERRECNCSRCDASLCYHLDSTSSGCCTNRNCKYYQPACKCSEPHSNFIHEAYKFHKAKKTVPKSIRMITMIFSYVLHVLR